MSPEEQIELESQIRQNEIDRIEAQTQQFQEQQNAPVTADQVSGKEYESPNEETQPAESQPQPEQAEMPQEEEEEKALGVGDVAGAIALGTVTAVPDFVMDAVGKVPGLGGLDDTYDEVTKWKDPRLQKIRSSMSIIIPSIAAGIGATLATKGRALPGVVKGLTTLGLGLTADLAVTGISDNSETEETLLTEVDKMAPGLNIPDRFITLDEDGPEVRREKNMYESVGFSLVGEIIGVAIGLGKPVFRWFKPQSPAAEAALSKGKQVVNSYAESTPNPLEAKVQYGADSRQMQIDEDALRSLEANPASVGYNPNIMSGIASESSTARQSIPPMAVARNMADTTGIKKGVAEGTPAPMMTSSMVDKGLQVAGGSRQVVMDLTEEARQLGRFSTEVNGFKYSMKDMTSAAWDIYESIVSADSVESLRELFVPSMVRQPLTDGRNIEYLNEMQATATGFAIRDLTQKYLGKEVTEMSARVMDTLGREVADISTASKELASVADPAAINKLITDKLHFLMDEYALNKYMAGWILNNKKWWKRLGTDGVEQATRLTEEFDSAIRANKIKNQNVIGELENILENNGDRRIGDALIEAFALSGGDVDTIAKTMEYFKKMNGMRGIFGSGEGGMNLFARGLTAVRYQNLLSGLAAANTALGTAAGLAIKPINAIIGLGMESLFSRDMKYIKGGLASYGAVIETNRRALAHSWQVFKKAMHDPDFSLSRARADMAVAEGKEWDFVDGLAKTMSWDKNFGELTLYNFNRMTHWLSRTPVMRLGTNLMVAADAYNGSAMASMLGRQDAYYKNVKGGKLDVAAFKAAEAENYKNMFDANGLITDDAVKYASGELALNLDSPAASAITQMTNKVPLMKAIFSFPRTGVEAFRAGVSYTPFLNKMPGISRTADILNAGDDMTKIKKALQAHGVKVEAPTEDLMNTYKNLRAEYRGRVAFSSMLAGGLFAYAMDGGIIGNGDPNAQVRRNQRNTLNVQPQTIRLPNGQYMSYKGWGEPFETTFSILGDMAYYANEMRGPITEDIQNKLMWTFFATFTQKTFVSQLEPFVALVTGDEGAMQRFLANEARSMIPLSGAQGVLAAAIDNTRKDIYGDMMGYIKSRLPGLSMTLPELRDVWTGKPLQDTSNPILRLFNAGTSFKISDGKEEWREELYEIGYDGVGLILGDGGTNTQYPAEIRDVLYEYIGKQQPWKKASRLLKSEKYQDDIKEIKALRAQGYTSEEIRLKNYPLFDRIDGALRDAQSAAELELRKANPELARYLELGKASRAYQQRGNSTKAQELIDEQRKLGKVLNISK